MNRSPERIPVSTFLIIIHRRRAGIYMIMSRKHQIDLIFVEQSRKRTTQIFVDSIRFIAVKRPVNEHNFPLSVRCRQIRFQPPSLPFQHIRQKPALLPFLAVQHDKMHIAVIKRINLTLQTLRSIFRQGKLRREKNGRRKTPFRSIAFMIPSQRHHRNVLDYPRRSRKPTLPLSIILTHIHKIAHVDQKSGIWILTHSSLQSCAPGSIINALRVAEYQEFKGNRFSRFGFERISITPTAAVSYLIAISHTRSQAGQGRGMDVDGSASCFESACQRSRNR